MTWAIAALLVAHGFAHLVGFVGSFALMPAKVPHATTLLGGRLDVGEGGIRAVGVLWLAAALAFFVMATATVLRTDWWARATAVVALASLALCLTSLPEAKIGIIVNVVIIVLVAVAVRASWPLAI
jgi:hypothetical protein